MNMRIGILTGGGDVQALNAVIASAIKTSSKLKIELIGFLGGWKGALENEYVLLNQTSFDSRVGGTILRSSRVNIHKIEGGSERILENLTQNRIAGLINIGGDDTLSNSFSIKSFPQVLIAKTIDNDVGRIEDGAEGFDPTSVTNYFTLGFPTAAEKISSWVSLREGLRTTAYSHERIILVEAMGMHSGWLALASAMGHPDYILIPEFPLDYDFLLNKIGSTYDQQKHLIVVVAEGARWNDGSYIFAQRDEIEEFGHPRFGGAADALRIRLKKDLAKFFNTRNINAVNPSYLYRSGQPNRLDRRWAENLGQRAVKALADGLRDSIFLSIQKSKTGFRIKDLPLANVRSMEELYRVVDRRFYNPENLQITEMGRTYMKEIIEEIPLSGNYGV